MSFGGSNAVVADIEHQTVAVHHWIAGREFADFFALTRAAPGPGSMLTAIIGWKVAGLAGALAATLCFYVPAAVLMYVMARLLGTVARAAVAWRDRARAGAGGRGLLIGGDRGARVARRMADLGCGVCGDRLADPLA